MARKPLNYWEKRSTELMLQLEKDTRYTINELIEVYKQSTKNINKEIENIFKNYAKDGVLKKEVLEQLLNKKESDLYYKKLLKTIDTIQDDTLKKQLYAKYNAPAYSFRISRLQALQNNIDVEMKKMAELEQTITEARYVKTIEDGYYHTMFDIQKGIGLGFNFSSVDMRVVNLMLSENWIDNKNFSKRIWNNTEKLGNYLKIHLTADTMTGKSISKTSKELAEYMNVGLYNATTLVRTEVNHFANEASMLAYEECEIDKYQFIATLDNRTCERCGNLDNKVFNVKDKKVGVNCPPIHPNDRCTTISYFDDETIEGLTRRAKDENGKSIKVPADMNYNEWKQKYVDKDEGIVQDIIYNGKTKGFKNVTAQKDKIINNSFKNDNIKKIALETDIKNIKLGGEKSFHLSGNIGLTENYEKRTVIHEIGHCIDYNNKWLSSSKMFKQAIIEDKKLIQQDKVLYKQIIKNNRQYREFSDIIGGMTNNEIKGRFGHSKKYWSKPNKLQRETFADLFTMAGNDDFKQLQLWQQYLPNTLKEFNNIIGRLL